jgi:YidC/Oxa1 family membrane protein insertase
MLDFVYYPVSALLWFWHWLFGLAFGPASAVAWMLAVAFLVVTFRAALAVPFLKQARAQRKLQKLRPRLLEIQKKYSKDRQRQALEMQKFQREHGLSLFPGLLPMTVQALVFIGLFHVLRSFDSRTNYFLGNEEVQSFLHATLFGAPLHAAMGTAGGAFTAVAAVAIPLVVLAAIASHFAARKSLSRQETTMPGGKAVATFGLWIVPGMLVVSGAALPIAVLVYWLTNSTWTLVQQRVIYRRIDADERVALGQ